MALELKILRHDLFNEYKNQLKVDVDRAFASIKKKPQQQMISNSILQIGLNYYDVKYERSIPFLSMLPNSLI